MRLCLVIVPPPLSLLPPDYADRSTFPSNRGQSRTWAEHETPKDQNMSCCQDSASQVVSTPFVHYYCVVAPSKLQPSTTNLRRDQHHLRRDQHHLPTRPTSPPTRPPPPPPRETEGQNNQRDPLGKQHGKQAARGATHKMEQTHCLTSHCCLLTRFRLEMVNSP